MKSVIGMLISTIVLMKNHCRSPIAGVPTLASCFPLWCCSRSLLLRMVRWQWRWGAVDMSRSRCGGVGRWNGNGDEMDWRWPCGVEQQVELMAKLPCESPNQMNIYPLYGYLDDAIRTVGWDEIGSWRGNAGELGWAYLPCYLQICSTINRN